MSTTKIDTDRETFSGTVKRLAGAQKPPAAGSPAYSRFVNRRIGRVLAAGAFHMGLTPNQVTLISAAFTFAGIFAIALVPPTLLGSILIALSLLVGYAFDSADGQLARLRGGGTPAGEWLDHVVDSVKASALHLAVLICWFRFYAFENTALLVPLAFTLVYAVYLFTLILTDQLRRAHPTHAPAQAGTGAGAILKSIAVAPADYGILCIIFVLLAWPIGFAVTYGLMFVGTTLLVAAALPKWYREISRFI